MGDAEPRRVPFSSTRRTIARRLRASVATKPSVTLFAYAGAEGINSLRDELNLRRPEEERLSISVILVKLVATALTRFPNLNGWVEEDALVLSPNANVGVAVDTQRGLMVPVLKKAEERSLDDLARDLRRLADAARERKLLPEDAADASFTLTNLGTHGVSYFTPIINPPQIATLGIGRVEDRPMLDAATQGWTVGRALPLSLSFDHAAVDGADAGRFLQYLGTLIDEPRLHATTSL